MPAFPTTRYLLETVCDRLEADGHHVEACQVAALAFSLADRPHELSADCWCQPTVEQP